MSDEYDTRVSLLIRLKAENDENDWEDFYHQYARFIVSVARKSGLSQSDAEDVLQETMIEMMRVLARFAYDRKKGTFRGYLRTIVSRKAARVRERNPNHVSLHQPIDDGKSPLMDLLEDENATGPLTNLDAVWKAAVLEEAVLRLEDDDAVSGDNLPVVQALLKGQSVAEIAAITGKKANAIYQVKHRVKQKLEEAVADILKDTA